MSRESKLFIKQHNTCIINLRYHKILATQGPLPMITLASGARPKTRPAWKRQARPGFPGFWPSLLGKCDLVKPGKHGHSQAFLPTLATKAWPSWPCYFQGRAFSATLVKKARPNPGLKNSSEAWPGFFEFPGRKFIKLSDCNIKPQNLWPFGVP